MKQINEKRIIKYCIGCGLCQALHIAELATDSKGFYYPVSGDESQLSKICPSVAKRIDNTNASMIWGREKGVYLGWSNSKSHRQAASSGGILTELCIYLLVTKEVDAIIQCGCDSLNPTKAVPYFSYTPEEVLSRAGSRYSISHPLNILGEMDLDKKYAFIGKPCDVTSLRNYLNLKKSLENNLKYIFSFFCMGSPSETVQMQLLSSLKCENCVSLSYRGNGWPGETVAVDALGNAHSMDYDSSWGNILGRDLMPMCRFCIDGIGEEADISCGDAWYILPNGNPDFSEHEGRNIIFARNSKGLALLKKIENDKKIILNEYIDYQKELPMIQKSQYDRRRNLKARIFTMNLLNKPCPTYPREMLDHYSKDSTAKDWLRTFNGTVKRILQKKI